MKISQIADLLGISKKTIRFYESKGLLQISRQQNSYREYNEDDIENIKNIKMLRSLGVSLSDIKLWQHQIVTVRELMQKRIEELKSENETNERQFSVCHELLSESKLDYDQVVKSHLLENYSEYKEQDTGEDKGNQPVTIGIDIGTTTISVTVMNSEGNVLYDCFTVRNASGRNTGNESNTIQDPKVIYEKVCAILNMIEQVYESILYIGLTGQMHGIVYLDSEGNAVSDLYTWQNQLGNQIINGRTYCEEITMLTEEVVASGFGAVTHYYLQKNNQIPKNAVKFCTIMDYIGLKITGRKTPLVHASNAASFGLYDVKKHCFMEDKLKKIQVDTSYFPECTADNTILGYYKTAPVAVAIGDNQASFIGAVSDFEKSVLVNIGTGSQVSVWCQDYQKEEDFEIRPFINGSYIKNYSALCGGSAYALLEKFIRNISVLCGGADKEMYELLGNMAEKAQESDDRIKVQTTFAGSRKNPEIRGKIENISMNNFTPEQLAFGFLEGIVNELYESYLKLNENKRGICKVVASGNCVRKNKVIQKILQTKFDLVFEISEYLEEAAVGAVKFAKECIK